MKIVVDGGALLHHIYFSKRIDFISGGQYQPKKFLRFSISLITPDWISWSMSVPCFSMLCCMLDSLPMLFLMDLSLVSNTKRYFEITTIFTF